MSPQPPSDTLNERVGVLTRREIEARILKPFVAALGARFGEAEVHRILADVVKAAARESGAATRVPAEADDLTHFAGAWEPWFRGGALEIDELERTPDSWLFNVTRCRYAELYRSLGMADLGATLSCNRDAALIEGFDLEVTFERTQTLMEGKSHCDFRYHKNKVQARVKSKATGVATLTDNILCKTPFVTRILLHTNDEMPTLRKKQRAEKTVPENPGNGSAIKIKTPATI